MAAVGFAPPAHAEDTDVSFAAISAQPAMTNAHAEVFRLYWAYFDRVPDPAGALYWATRVSECVPLSTVSGYFAASDEFRLTYGDQSNQEFVDLVYHNVLDRTPDPEGLDYWLDLLDNEGLSRGRLMTEFSRSDEFTWAHPLPSDGQPDDRCHHWTPHSYQLQSFPEFATIGPVRLTLPSEAVEIIGFHESTHDGSQPMTLIDPDLVPTFVMASRGRGNPAMGAADIAVHPLLELRSPVTGTVLRSGEYTLYCRYPDDFLIVAPDANPGWEVKILHIKDVAVHPGDRVLSGETVISPGAHPLPFRSQVDGATPNPSWAHVHVEVIDPSIPDRPGHGC